MGSFINDVTVLGQIFFDGVDESLVLKRVKIGSGYQKLRDVTYRPSFMRIYMQRDIGVGCIIILNPTLLNTIKTVLN